MAYGYTLSEGNIICRGEEKKVSLGGETSDE